MIKIYKAINSLLTSFVHDKPPVLPNNLDYNKLYIVSKTQHIDGILGFVFSKHNCAFGTTIDKRFLNSYISAITINTNQIHLFDKTSKHLSDNKITLVTFKGYPLRKVYPIPELRSFSDIDILIKESDRNKTHEIMIKQGFTCEVDYGNVYNYRKGIEYYEFHTSLINSDIFESKNLNDYFNSAFDHTYETDNGLLEFEDEFHLIYLISHIAKHIHYGGAGIRMYLDIALFIKNKRDFDYNHFIKTTEALGIDKFSCTVINAACTWFSLDIPSFVKNKYEISGETLSELYYFTIDKGLFGNAMESSGEATVQLMKKKGSKRPKLDALLSVTFPKLKVMKLKYRYLDKAPFLLPISWIQRAISNVGKINSKKKKIQDIISTDNNTINKHQNLLDNIGL